MIVEERIYTVQPTKARAFIRILEEGGYAIQSEHLGKAIGFFTTEFGPLNQVIHLWKYESMEDRSRRRAALQADPRWQEVVKQLSALVVKQENKLLVPAPFTPV